RRGARGLRRRANRTPDRGERGHEPHFSVPAHRDRTVPRFGRVPRPGSSGRRLVTMRDRSEQRSTDMRRGVTGIDGDGRSRVVSDEEAPKQIPISAGTMTELWYTPPGVGLLPIGDDPTMTADASPMSFPVAGGFAWRVCEFHPGSSPMGMHHTPT